MFSQSKDITITNDYYSLIEFCPILRGLNHEAEEKVADICAKEKTEIRTLHKKTKVNLSTLANLRKEGAEPKGFEQPIEETIDKIFEK